MQSPISETTLDIIRQQLGREPRGIVRIAAQTDSAVPLVLQMRSVVDKKPFPTLYWLASKDLGKAIGSIETTGWVKLLEERLRDDDAFMQAYQACQQSYVAKRTDAMFDDDKSWLQEIGLFDTFSRMASAVWPIGNKFVVCTCNTPIIWRITM